ncbi:MAG TPA: hypothetical protein VEJ89_01205 [Myxococcaceae bacterium]|jgi:hypothetical protein|nr:hypothetical protein [Myxococcaceae bacterium]
MSRSSLLVALPLLAGACGGGSSASPTLCDNLATATTDFAAKAAPCFSTVPSLGFSTAVCRSSLSNCSDSDQQRISSFTSCIEALPACAPATLQSWTSSFQSCTATLGPLQGSGC